MSRTSRNSSVPSLSGTIRNFSDYVASISRDMAAYFSHLYKNPSYIQEKSSQIPSGEIDERIFSSVRHVISSINNPTVRAERLVRYVRGIVEEVTKDIEHFDKFIHSEIENINQTTKIEAKFREVIDACLLLKDALDKDLFQKESVKDKRGNVIAMKYSDLEMDAKNFVRQFLTWKYTSSISSKLPKFGEVEHYDNLALYQQLTGYVPLNPISEQIMPFSLLEWQRKMFLNLRNRMNVIVCAPTSSGKTMIALGYILAFLENEPKSILIYVVPNDTLGLEISATLNKFVKDRVSTILDTIEERKQDERVIVCTPKGANNTKMVRESLPKDALLVVDEVHCIENITGPLMEYLLRRISKVQTLILSATMTDETIEKLKSAIRPSNGLPIVVINESTRFMNPQFMIPRLKNEEANLISINSIGSVSQEELRNPDLDITLTSRDVLSFFVKIVGTFGSDVVPEYLHPIRFFYIHRCSPPENFISLQEVEPEESDDEEEEEEKVSRNVPHGTITRLSLEDIAKWQKALIHFLTNPPKESLEGHVTKKKEWTSSIQIILDQFKSSLTDDTTCACTIQNACKVVDQLKIRGMLPAIFFFPSLFQAFTYASEIYKYLADKAPVLDGEAQDVQRQRRIEALEKQVRSMKQAKLGHNTDVKAHKERYYILKLELQNLKSEASNFHLEHSLNPLTVITPEALTNLHQTLRNWNANITLSSPMVQMIKYGIGVLSGDMPHELQVAIRKLYAEKTLSLLMVTEDCAYGINTPTRTVLLSDGFSETQRRQMAGRAGRKGFGYNAWIISFRLNNAREAGQQLRTLVGRKVEIYAGNHFPHEEIWITQFNRQPHPYILPKSIDDDDKFLTFFCTNRFLYGHGAIIAPLLLQELIKSTAGETNRHIKVILSILPCTPYDRPFRAKEGWAYEIPSSVRQIYIDNHLSELVPNNLLYLWLTNQVENLSKTDLEMFVENAKHWIFLFHMLKPFFTTNDQPLYNQIHEIFTRRMIDTAIGF